LEPGPDGSQSKATRCKLAGRDSSKEYGISPQVMNYVLPLLIEEGFCTVRDNKPFLIHRSR